MRSPCPCFPLSWMRCRWDSCASIWWSFESSLSSQPVVSWLCSSQGYFHPAKLDVFAILQFEGFCALHGTADFINDLRFFVRSFFFFFYQNHIDFLWTKLYSSLNEWAASSRGFTCFPSLLLCLLRILWDVWLNFWPKIIRSGRCLNLGQSPLGPSVL